MRFQDRARWLYRIVLIQQVTKLVLRAAWLGGAVYLFSWGANSLWGVLPYSGVWVLFSLIIGSVTLLSAFTKPRKMKEFIWRVDRKFDQQEQVATAYQVAEAGEQGGKQEESLKSLLISEAVQVLPGIIKRVIDKGWGLRSDIEATVIVLMLLMVVYLSGMESFTTSFPGMSLVNLPGAGGDPTFLDIYASGIPGDTTGSSTDLFEQPGDEQDEDFDSGNYDVNLDSRDKLNEVLQQMGTQLKYGSATAGFGLALEDGDYRDAAGKLRSLSENIDRASDETLQSLADAFSYGVRELYMEQYEEITEVLGNAVLALEGDSVDEMGTELDNVANMLESFAANEQDEVYALEQNEETDIERIAGEGEDIEVQSAEDISDLLVAPGSGEGDFGVVLGGAVDMIGLTSESEDDSLNLSTYDYSWEDIDVVSSYFSPR